uniref:Mitochondrial import inner membrane translocase subunit Tim21 n=1 Tax=Caenorhabditis tropicalis TaxID=1561998 RepID=A0A1I7T4Q9_9PELO
MDSDWESSFEFVSETGATKRKAKQTIEEEPVVEMKTLGAELSKKALERERKRKRIDHEKIIFEFLAVLGFATGMMFLCLSDLVDVTFIKNPARMKAAKIEKAGMVGFDAEDTFKSRVMDFMAEVKMNGRANRAPKTMEDSALFYVLSEKQPIEVAFRREWIADPSFFEGVDRFVRGMEWENTFEEDLFVRGVPNFDFKFEIEEITLKTTLHDKHFNHKFLNLGRKEMIDKNHSVEYFISSRTLVRLERKHGIEVARTEYFLKLGDLHVYDKRGDLECTRVYYAPVIDDAMFKRVTKQ